MKIASYKSAISILVFWITVSPQSAIAGPPQCARMYTQGYSEFVFNMCNKCRRISIQRRRVGTRGAPVMRIYSLQPRSTFPLPFKGPGRSRVTSDVPCRNEQGGGRDILNPGKQNRFDRQKTCVSLRNTRSGGVALVNKCRKCRAAAVIRYAHSGSTIGRQYYKLNPHSSIKLLPKGASKVAYLTDVACP